MRAWPILFTSATVVFTSATALAQDNSASVEALFSDGKRLAAEGNFEAACPKFRASYNLDHRIGTLLNLADCYEKNNQLASAWARFVEVRGLAGRAGQTERQQYASEHVAALEPKLSTLTIKVNGAAPGLVVKRDDEQVDAAGWGVAVPVDAGTHRIQASAPGKQTVTREIKVDGNADRKSIELPPLEDSTAAPVAEPGARVGVSDARRDKPSSTRTTFAIVTAGVGVASLGVGTYFGVAALGKKSDSKVSCGLLGNPNDCTQPGFDARNEARSDGTLSTVMVSLGAALVVTGAVLWLTAPTSRATTAVGFDGHALFLRGSFQ